MDRVPILSRQLQRHAAVRGLQYEVAGSFQYFPDISADARLVFGDQNGLAPFGNGFRAWGIDGFSSSLRGREPDFENTPVARLTGNCDCASALRHNSVYR